MNFEENHIDTNKAFNAKMEIAGFWIRPLAYLIDVIVLWLIGLCLGLFFSDYFSDMGPWGVLVGFSIAVTYFTILESNVAGGQSVGKTLLKLKVVSRNGEPLSLLKSFIRATMVCVPLLRGFRAYSGDQMFWFLLPTAIVYLYVFNQKTRQSVQDLVVNSLVVKENISTTDRFTDVIWRGHYVLLAMVLTAILTVFVGIRKIIVTNPSTIALQNIFKKDPEVVSVEINEMLANRLSFPYGNQKVEVSMAVPIKTLTVFVGAKNKANVNPELIAKRFEKIILRENPDVDSIMFFTSQGFDIGLYSEMRRQVYHFGSKSFKQKQLETLQNQLRTLESEQ
ncbi:MAG: hypothetical protein K0R08_333 [Solimicrobium sp.]|jgi:uncharacterized RDD family membrane protein YckC|nr:hypothetical protein [Solimicrobium sp.]